MSNHTSPSVPYWLIPANKFEILAGWPASGPTAVSDTSTGLAVNIRIWAIVLPKMLKKVSEGR